MLDEFVTEEVEERISAARNAVSDVVGVGTTAAQTRWVRDFPAPAWEMLCKALEDHLATRTHEHGGILTGKAEELPAKALTGVTVESGGGRLPMEGAGHERIEPALDGTQISAVVSSVVGLLRLE